MAKFLLLLSQFFTRCLAALDLGADVEQPVDCLIVQSRQAMQSMGRSTDWALEDNMVYGLFFCDARTGSRGGLYPICTDRSPVCPVPCPVCPVLHVLRGDRIC